MNDAITIRRAEPGDAIAISSVLAANLDDSGLLQESADALAHTLADFFVARNDAGTIVGSAGLHRDSGGLAEVYAVADTPQHQGQSIGGELMGACQQHAISSGIRHLWLATMKPEYCSRYGFQPVSRWGLPASALLRKLRQTLQQPSGRWLPALFGRHTFILCTLDSFSLPHLQH